jgi:DNA-binding NarL/FixJ family response regulator
MKNYMSSAAFGLAQRNIKGGMGAMPSGKPAYRGSVAAHSHLSTGIRTALVDCYSLSRDCIISAIHALESDIEIVPFSSIRECINYSGNDLNIIVYYCHEDGPLDHLMGQEVTTLRQAFSDLPIIVLSDAKQASQSRIAKAVLRSGARGFIPTRTIEMPIVPASIRYVSEGGMIVPVELLFTDKPEDDLPLDQDAIPAGLTSRQVAVLAHLRQGKPNKIIAHDLHMSESTVKVHIRNIMRKMGATNRTQAVYKARQLYNSPDGARA